MKCPLIAGFVQKKWLNISVRVRLTEVSAERRFILQSMWEEDLGTRAGVLLIEGVRLIWGALNTGFTVTEKLMKVNLLNVMLSAKFPIIVVLISMPFIQRILPWLEWAVPVFSIFLCHVKYQTCYVS